MKMFIACLLTVILQLSTITFAFYKHVYYTAIYLVPMTLIMMYLTVFWYKELDRR